MRIVNFEVFADEDQALVTYDNGHEELVRAERQQQIGICRNCFFNTKIDGKNSCGLFYLYLINTKKAYCSANSRMDNKSISWVLES